NYLNTMQIPLEQGRDFGPEDAETAPKVAMVSAAFAKRVFGDHSPIGERIKVGGMDGPWRTIVGVTGNIHHQGLDAEAEAELYLPSTQTPWANSRMVMLLRGSDPSQLTVTIRRLVQTLDPTIPISRIATMDDLVRLTTAERRFALLVFESFGVIALLLAAAGLYGVLAASVSARTREIGIRSALGAGRAQAVGLIIRPGAGVAIVGFVV